MRQLIETQRCKKDKVNGDSGLICQRLTIKALLGSNVIMVLLFCQSSCRVCSSRNSFCELDPVNLQLSAEYVPVSSYATMEVFFCRRV